MRTISIKASEGRRARLLAALAILLLSATLLAAAFNIVNRNMQSTGAGAQTTTTVEVELVVKYVNGTLNLVLPLQTNFTKASNSTLFLIIGSTGTSYMRNFVGETYSNGEWYSNLSSPLGYGGENLELAAPKYADSETEKNVIIKPALDLQGVIPSMKDTNLLSILPQSAQTDLLYYQDQELFYSSRPLDSPYNLSYNIYNFDPQILNNATVNEDAEYLSVPQSLAKDLQSLAENVTGNTTSLYEKCKELESYLQSNYVYSQNLTAAPNGTDPIEWFLFHDKKGVCTQFNTAFVLMARTLGLPARLVGGYAINSTEVSQEVTQQDSHAYSEVFFNDVGWITFDATAPLPNKAVPANNLSVHTYPSSYYYQQGDIPGRITTYTTILSCPKIGVNGDNFTVYGTVTTWIRQLELSHISGLIVLITLSKDKLEQGTFVGEGMTINGYFNITCMIPSNFTSGDYNVTARTLGNGVYNGSSSDPIITVMTGTKIDLITPQEVESLNLIFNCEFTMRCAESPRL
ncbi:MAG: transglutaminase-like domain-containing protein [Nitrososphaeria archaeon]